MFLKTHDHPLCLQDFYMLEGTHSGMHQKSVTVVAENMYSPGDIGLLELGEGV